MNTYNGVFLERPNRFVARVQLANGKIRPVHVASSGRMTELLTPGTEVLVRGDGKPGQKTEGKLAMVNHGGVWVSVDTSVPGKLLRMWWEVGAMPAFAGYQTVQPEVRYGESRIDFLLTGPGLPPCLVEVKSVTSVVPDADGALVGRFPDAPTARGARHLQELQQAKTEGYRSAVFFVVQRSDAVAFGPWDQVDPCFGQVLRQAYLAGVEIHAWAAHVTPEAIRLSRELPIRL